MCGSRARVGRIVPSRQSDLPRARSGLTVLRSVIRISRIHISICYRHGFRFPRYCSVARQGHRPSAFAGARSGGRGMTANGGQPRRSGAHPVAKRILPFRTGAEPAPKRLARPSEALAASSRLPLQPARRLPRSRRDASNGVTPGALHLGPGERLRDPSPARSPRRDPGAREPATRPLPRGEVRPRASGFPGTSRRGRAAQGLGQCPGSGRRSGGKLLRPAHSSLARQDPRAGGDGSCPHALPCRRFRPSSGSGRARTCPCVRRRVRGCARARTSHAATADEPAPAAAQTHPDPRGRGRFLGPGGIGGRCASVASGFAERIPAGGHGRRRPRDSESTSKSDDERRAWRRLYRRARRQIEALESEVSRVPPVSDIGESLVPVSDKRGAGPESESARLPCDLAGRVVAYVGGRGRVVPRLRALTERCNGRFVYHDGGLQERAGRIDESLAGSDIVVVPLDCVSHDASRRLKRRCRQQGKTILWLRTASVSAFEGALQRAIQAQVKEPDRECVFPG